MLAANGSETILEPLHYLEEKPFEIIQNLRRNKRKFPFKTVTTTKNKTISEKKQSGMVEMGNIIKKELETSYDEDDEQEALQESTTDPLLTPQVVVKDEIDEEKIEPSTEDADEKFVNSDDDKDFRIDEHVGNHDEEQQVKRRKKTGTRKITQASGDIDELYGDDDDEPLIRMQENLVRETGKTAKGPRLKDCQETCKHKCTRKFERQQRLDIYHFYWQLSQEHKINFLRTHVRKPVVKYIQTNSLRCCYFLKHYKLPDTGVTTEAVALQTSFSNGINIFSPDDKELTKVCRKFFTGTLKIPDQEIKEAVKDFELIPEQIKKPIKDTQKADVIKVPKIQYLDPETGTLTDTRPKKPNKRRKTNEPPPKRLPKPVKCAISCKFKCHQKFSEEERKQICDVFWSLDYQRRKDFVLSRIEIKDVKRRLNPEYRKTNGPTRSYQTKYYLRPGPKTENVRVCKHFMENTLNVHKCFIENAIEFSDKTTGAYTGFDRRVQNNKIDADRLQAVLDHIGSYPFWLPNKKGKTKYLHHSLTIRKMYEDYKEKCLAKNLDVVSVNFYYKVFHKDFHILFLANPHSEKGRGYFKSNPNISHYTGDEAGGCWFDSTGTRLDERSINPATTTDATTNNTRTSSPPKECDAFSSGSDPLALNLVQNPVKTMPNQDSSCAAARPNVLNHDSYGNFFKKPI